jgi:hypothetical protein
MEMGGLEGYSGLLHTPTNMQCNAELWLMPVLTLHSSTPTEVPTCYRARSS